MAPLLVPLLLLGAPQLAPSSHGAVAAEGPGPLPSGWVRPGRLHKLRVESEEAVADLAARGAVRTDEDYGSFHLLLVDEEAAGGREELLRAGEVRDELDLIAFRTFRIDARDPEATLARLPRDERFGRADATALDELAGLYVIQFAGPVRSEWLGEVERLGGEPLQYVPMNAYVLRVAPPDVRTLESHARTAPEVQYLGAYHPAYRISRGLRARVERSPDALLEVVVQRIADPGVPAVGSSVAVLAERVHGSVSVGPYENVYAAVHAGVVATLAAAPDVMAITEAPWVEPAGESQAQILAGNVTPDGSAVTAPNYLEWLASEGFDGSQFGDFVVHMVDFERFIRGHPDLPDERIVFQRNPLGGRPNTVGHGFRVAHVIAGFNDGKGRAFEDENGLNYGLGVAPWARIGSTAILGSPPYVFDNVAWERVAHSRGARISTNSYGVGHGKGQASVDYETVAQAFDYITRDARPDLPGNQPMIMFAPVGNGGPTPGTVTSPCTSKSVISVGGSEGLAIGSESYEFSCCVWPPTAPEVCGDSVGDVAYFSAGGPVDAASGDGRIKPDVLTPANLVTAGVPQDPSYTGLLCNKYWPPGQTLYTLCRGTSFSIPAAAGAGALLYQDFLNHGYAPPSPALMKAVLMGTASYMTGYRAGDDLPSNDQGMGRLDLGRALDDVPRILVDQTELLVETGQRVVVRGRVADRSRELRIVLAWSDAPGPVNGSPWVNDLDLVVRTRNETYLGNVFSGPHSVQGGSADFRDNVESVFLPPGRNGVFTAEVRASNLAGDGVPGNAHPIDQDFALFVYNAHRLPH